MRDVRRPTWEQPDRQQPIAGSGLAQQLKDFRLTLAEITYRMPDHQAMLQTFVWQGLDRAPDYPRLLAFLNYWRENLDGPLHSVRVGQSQVLAAPRYRNQQSSLLVH